MSCIFSFRTPWIFPSGRFTLWILLFWTSCILETLDCVFIFRTPCLIQFCGFSTRDFPLWCGDYQIYIFKHLYLLGITFLKIIFWFFVHHLNCLMHLWTPYWWHINYYRVLLVNFRYGIVDKWMLFAYSTLSTSIPPAADTFNLSAAKLHFFTAYGRSVININTLPLLPFSETNFLSTWIIRASHDQKLFWLKLGCFFLCLLLGHLIKLLQQYLLLLLVFSSPLL